MPSEGGINLATAYVQLTTSAEGVGKEIIGKVGGAGDEAGKAGGDAAAKSFGQRFTSVLSSGKALAGGAVVAAVVGSVKGLYKVGGIFDDVADTIRVGTGATGANLDALVGVAKNVGKTVPVQFDKIGPVVADLNTRLGLTGDNLTAVAQQYLQAGHILGEDVDIKASTGAMSAFGIAGKDVSGALDQLFSVAQDTGVSMNELSSVVQTQGPTMKNLGFSYGQTANLVGQLDKAGVNSNQVMASMSKGLATLAKSGKDPQKAFADVTGQVEKYVKAGDTAGAINVAAKIFGTRGAAQFVAAVQSGTLSVDALNKTTVDASDTILGAASDTADFAESWQMFKNKALLAVQPAAAKVFDALGTGMDKVAKGFDGALSSATAFVGGLRARVSAAAKPLQATLSKSWGQAPEGVILSWRDIMSNGVGLVLNAASGTVRTFAGAAAPGFSAVGDAIKPFVSAAATILPALSPVKFLFDAMKPLLPTIAQMLGQVASVLGGALASVMTSVTPLLTTIGDVVGRLASMLTPLIASLLPPLNTLFGQLAPLLNAVLGAILPIVDAISSALIPIINALMPVVQTVFGAIGPIITDVMSVFSGLITFVTGVFSGDWGAAWDGIKQVFEGIWNGVKDFISGIWDTIKSIFSTAWDLIKPIVMTPVEAIKTGITVAFNAVSSFLSGAWNGIKSAANVAWTAIKAVIITPLEMLQAGISAAIGGVASFLSGVWDGIKSTAKTAWNLVHDYVVKPLETAYNWVKTTFTNIGTTISNAVSGVVDFIKKPINAVIDGVNWVIRQLNKMSFKVPDWVPVIGGKGFGFNIGEIPHLATGGVVSEPTLAVVGDAGAGNPEIVAPQRMIRDIIRQESSESRPSWVDDLIEAVYAAADVTVDGVGGSIRGEGRRQSMLAMTGAV